MGPIRRGAEPAEPYLLSGPIEVRRRRLFPRSGAPGGRGEQEIVRLAARETRAGQARVLAGLRLSSRSTMPTSMSSMMSTVIPGAPVSTWIAAPSVAVVR